MKKLFAILIIGVLCAFVFADEKSDLEENYDALVLVMITANGALPQNTALNNTPPANTNHPGQEPCTWYIDGLTFMTWFIDSSAGYIPTDTFFPGDGDNGHALLWDISMPDLMMYMFTMENFKTVGRGGDAILASGDTLHMLFRYQDAAGDVYYGCFDTIYHEPYALDMQTIMIDLQMNPGDPCCVSHLCTPCPWGLQEKPTPPTAFYLAQNSPNPFNSATEIEYYIPKDADVTIDVYDLTGKKITSLVSEHQTAGTYAVKWNATDDKGNSMPTGSYFYKIKAGDYETQKRMLYIK